MNYQFILFCSHIIGSFPSFGAWIVRGLFDCDRVLALLQYHTILSRLVHPSFPAPSLTMLPFPLLIFVGVFHPLSTGTPFFPRSEFGEHATVSASASDLCRHLFFFHRLRDFYIDDRINGMVKLNQVNLSLGSFFVALEAS